MAVEITLSQCSRKLFNDLNQEDVPKTETINSAELLRWINKKEADLDCSIKDKTFFLESLRAALLHDYARSLKDKEPDKKNKPKNWPARIKLIGLGIAGTILFGCEGFDSITALLGIFNVPMLVTLIVGTVFSLFSIMVFFGFDLVEISKNLGVKLTNAPKLLDIYIEQLKSSHAIRHEISLKIQKASLEDLENYLATLELLKARLDALKDAKLKFQEILNHKGLKVAQYTTAAIAGLLFFGGGYFAGNAVALFAVGLIIGSTANPLMWPVIAISVAVGIAALSIYWFVERPAVQNLISTWFGLDKERIDEFCNDKKAKREEIKLAREIKSVANKIDSLEVSTASSPPLENTIDNPATTDFSLMKPSQPTISPRVSNLGLFSPDNRKMGRSQSNPSLATLETNNSAVAEKFAVAHVDPFHDMCVLSS